MTDLAEFLNARLDKDEVAALKSRNAPEDATRYVDADRYSEALLGIFDDERVLREARAKRKILAAYRDANEGSIVWDVLGFAVTVLAAVYSDHPDYDPAWK
jgi:hypothetical protein